MFAMSFALFIPGGASYWFGSISSMATYATNAGLALLGFASFYLMLGAVYIAWPKTIFIQTNNDELRLYFGFPGLRKTFRIPLADVESVVMAPSPFKWLHWGKIAPPEKVQEDREIIKVQFSKPLSSTLREKANILKNRNLPLFHFRVSDDGTNLFIRTEPIGGFGQLIKAIEEGHVS